MTTTRQKLIGVGLPLAHVVQNKVEAACRRTELFERRRGLMEDWAAYLAGETREPLGYSGAPKTKTPRRRSGDQEPLQTISPRSYADSTPLATSHNLHEV